MMDTILNLGLNDDTTAGLATSVGEPEVRRQLPRPLRARCSADDRRRGDRAGGSLGPASGCHRGSLPLLEQRPRPGLPRPRGDPRRPGHGSDRPGDGLRQPQRRLRDRRALHPQPGDRRARPVRRRHVQRPGRGRRRRHPPDGADRRPGRAAADRRAASSASTRLDSSATTGTSATSSSRSSTARCGCSSAGSGSAARRRPSGSRSTWPRTRHSRSRGRRPCAGSRRSSANPPTITTGRDDTVPVLATGLPASPGVACGEIATTPDAAVAVAEAGRAVDPRARGDLPRRRPRDGPVGRDPHLHAAASRATRRWSRGAGGSPRWWAPPQSGSSATSSRSASGRCRAGDTITIDGGTGEVFAGAIGGDTGCRPRSRDAARLGRRARDPDRRR